MPASPEVESSPPKRGRWVIPAWCLYDFANSTYTAVIVSTVYSVYYVKHVVGNDDGRGDFWWGAVATNLSAIFVALTAPVMGAIADLSGARRLLWSSYTTVAVVATALMVTVEKGDVIWGCAIFVIANFAAEGATNFYNAYLPEIVSRDRIGRVSGWGFALGYVGSLAGLGIALPLKNNVDAVFLVVAALFAAFALPAIILVGPGGKRSMTVPAAAAHGLKHVGRIFREVLATRDLRRFLLAYFLYINGVNAAVTFAGPLAATTFGLDLSGVVRLFILVQVSALVGALLMAKPTDVLGARRVVQVSLCLWILTASSLVVIQDVRLFWAACVIAGLGLGSIQAASRTYMTTLIPKGREDELFGFYALCGKTSAPLGAMTWGVVSHATGSQRLAVAALVPFFIAGLFALSRAGGGGPTATR